MSYILLVTTQELHTMWQVYDTRTDKMVSEHFDEVTAWCSANALNFVRQKDVFSVRPVYRAKNWGDFS